MRGIKIAVAGVFAASTVAANAATYVLHAPAWGAKQEAAVAKAGGTVSYSHDGAGVAVVESSNPGFMKAVLAGGAITGGAQDMVVQWTAPMPTEALPDAINPMDDRFYSTIQWAPQSVEAPAAWSMGYTGRGVRVAVIDGGIYNAHPDLAANIDVAASRSFVLPSTADTPAGNACRIAFNCDTGTFWHGTHVAGIVAAADNTIGVVGIAPEATIVGVKALHNGSGSFGAVINALLYASTEGRADIINMSLGAVFPRGHRDGAELTSALNRAVNFATRNGSLVVVAAGNDGAGHGPDGQCHRDPGRVGQRHRRLRDRSAGLPLRRHRLQPPGLVLQLRQFAGDGLGARRRLRLRGQRGVHPAHHRGPGDHSVLGVRHGAQHVADRLYAGRPAPAWPRPLRRPWRRSSSRSTPASRWAS